jgi:hypothetical protein
VNVIRTLPVDPWVLMAWAVAVAVIGAGIGVQSASAPHLVYGVSMGLLGLLVARAIFAQKARRYGLPMTIVAFGLSGRVAMAFAYIGIVSFFYGSADFVSYARVAREVAERFLEGNFTLIRGEQWLDLNPVFLTLLGLMSLVSGPGVVGLFIVSAILGFTGAYLMYRAAVVARGGEIHRPTLWVILFALPSFVLWTSVLGKDSWMLFFSGIATYGFARMLTTPRARWAIVLLAGIGGVMAIRFAIGAILVSAIVTAVLFVRRPASSPAAILRPIAVIVLPIIAVPAFMKLAQRAAVERMGEALETITEEAGVVWALSRYHQGLALDAGTPDMISITDASAFSLLAYLPSGMFTLFFRPFIFEAHNALAAVAALENTFLLVLVIARFRSLARSVARCRHEPFLVFCWVATLLLSAVISLAPNFGVLIRQRAMVLPFAAILLAVTPRAKQAAEGAAA